MAPLSAFQLFWFSTPSRVYLTEEKKLLKLSPVGVGGAGGRFAPPALPASADSTRTHAGIAEPGPDPPPFPAPALTCAALAPARVAGVPGQANSTSAGKERNAPSNAQAGRAQSCRPRRRGTQARGPQHLRTRWRSGLGRRGGAAAARITAPGEGARPPEGTSWPLTVGSTAMPSLGRRDLGLWVGGGGLGRAPLGGVAAVGGRGGPRTPGERDRRQGLRLRRECQLGSPNSLEVE